MVSKKTTPNSKANKNSRAKASSKPAVPPKAGKASEPNTMAPSGATIVGIAGSAGSLSALQTFFSALPAEPGMAFVVVTHLSPEHESHLASLIQPYTHMTVTQVNRRMPVRINHVYVIPPSRNILISDAHVDVAEFDEPRSKRAPVDFFLRTLGRSHRDAVAIILSGGGTDGSVGMKDIKEEGGLVMAQDPEEAEYPSMPNAAISTGLVDVVLPVRELAARLMKYAEHIPGLGVEPESLDDKEWGLVQNILAQVQRRTKHDFTQYKRSTVLRRIRRRMVLNTHPSLEAYLEHIRQHPAESFALLNDLLIGVTNFFRDHEAWEALAKDVIPQLFKQKGMEEPIRVWSVGCASGEEAYSLAMLLMEAASALDENRTIQVFASDIDDDALARAREGLYPTAIEADVSSDRLERFFTRQGDHYQVRRELRDMILFTPHSVLRDPPFSHQDLVVCRNLLIYLQREIQQYVLEVFHYVLDPGGYLFVGNSELISGKEAFFQTIDKKYRIYQVKPWPVEQARVPALPLAVRTPERGRLTSASRPTPHLRAEPQMLEEQHRRSLEAYGPPSILVGTDYSVLHTSDSAGRYLLHPKGPITSDALKLVRPELQGELRTALFQAFDKGRASVSAPVIVNFGEEERPVTIAAYPRKVPGDKGQALVVFLEDEVHAPLQGAAESGDEKRGQSNALVSQLQTETQRLRDQLQTTTEEYESSTEEMKAANEELQSINEEYHLTTEELETSKEELEAVNEELQTVNNELKAKLEEISHAHRDLESVMGAMEIATLFLDRQLRIQRYTPALNQFFNILKADIGRPIDHLKPIVGVYGELTRDARNVLDSLNVVDREVEGENGKWYLIRLRPYRTTEDHIEGVVITFVDITDVKQADLALRRMNETLEARVQDRTSELETINRRLGQSNTMFSMLFNVNPIPTSLTRLEDGQFLDVNEAYARFFEMSREEILKHTTEELSLPFQRPGREEILRRLRRDGLIRNLEVEMKRRSGDVRTLLASLQHLSMDGTDAMLSTFIDITDRVRAERQIRALAASLTAAEQKERHRISQVLHDDLQQRLFAIKMQASFLRQAYQEGNGKAIDADQQELEEGLARAIETTRRLSIDLSPVILQGAPLADAIAWLKEDVKEQYGLQLKTEIKGSPPDLEEHLRVLLFNTLRELLFNVVKHSGIMEARLLIDATKGPLRITLNDHGKGFDAETVLSDPKAAHGLLMLRNRLSLLGCSMQVKSKPGDGTEISIEVAA